MEDESKELRRLLLGFPRAKNDEEAVSLLFRVPLRKAPHSRRLAGPVPTNVESFVL